MSSTIVVVGPGRRCADALTEGLGDRIPWVANVGSAAEAWNLLQTVRVQLLIVHERLCDMPGERFARFVREDPRFRNVPLFLLQDRPGLDDRHADAVFEWPGDQAELFTCVSSLLGRGGRAGACGAGGDPELGVAAW